MTNKELQIRLEKTIQQLKQHSDESIVRVWASTNRSNDFEGIVLKQFVVTSDTLDDKEIIDLSIS